MDILFKLIEQQLINKDKVIIAIDGPSCSGKSTLGQLLKEKYTGVLFHTDDYFLHPSRKTKERLIESGGNFDYERIKTEIFDHLKDKLIQSNHFNCSSNILEQSTPQENKKIIIVEGAYCLHKSIINNYSIKVLLTINKEEQLSRILKRNGEIMLNRFITEWIPLEQHYFKTEYLENKCDIVTEYKK